MTMDDTASSATGTKTNESGDATIDTREEETAGSTIDWDRRERESSEEEERQEAVSMDAHELTSDSRNVDELLPVVNGAQEDKHPADLDPASYTVGSDNKPIPSGEDADPRKDEAEDDLEGSVSQHMPSEESERQTTGKELPELSKEEIGAFEKIGTRHAKYGDTLTAVEARRNAFVLPFISALGYEVFDPDEVQTGYAAIGKSADYAIRKGDDDPFLFVTLSDALSDESRNMTDRTLACVKDDADAAAIITDGHEFRVYAGGELPQYGNPSIVYKLGNEATNALASIAKDRYDPAALREYGAQEGLRQSIFNAVRQELMYPSEGFIEAIVSRLVADGVKAPRDMEEQVEAVTRPLADHLERAIAEAEEMERTEAEAEDNDDRVMTDEEEKAFEMIKEICSEYTDPSNIFARPAKSYLAVLLTDNNRRTIARLHFNYSRKYVGTFIEREETRNQIEGPEGVREYVQQFIERMHELDPSIDITPETVEDERPTGQEEGETQPTQD